MKILRFNLRDFDRLIRDAIVYQDDQADSLVRQFLVSHFQSAGGIEGGHDDNDFALTTH
jgi:hypothetical protein